MIAFTLQQRNSAFMARINRIATFPRLRMTDELAHRKNEGRDIGEPETPKTKGSGKTRSYRSKVAALVRHSTELKARSTNAQLRAYAFIRADRLIATQRKAEKAVRTK